MDHDPPTPSRIATGPPNGSPSVSPGTIRQYIADGKLRCVKIGRLIKIDARDLVALIHTIDNS
ncbi:helix-turn-helix domain-containing protein [Mycolicibacterium novocastrense]|uniref:helix-turn-helix domain-containing protein n=1 Tax=Mycolicibacterium novocastrense TaxID=59813 RepID=UPI0021F2E511